MTKEEAEKEAQRRNAEPATKFCPLINAICNNDCVCYRVAGVFEDRRYMDSFIVSEPGCGNAMFFNNCGCNG